MLLSIPQPFNLGSFGVFGVNIGLGMAWKDMENRGYPLCSRSIETCYTCNFG